MPVDEGQLLRFLDERRKYPVPVVGAIYEGLATRVRRGEFEEEVGRADPQHQA